MCAGDAIIISAAHSNGSSAYTRSDHKVKSADALIKQVRACVTQLNVQWFPDEEEQVAAYLNEKYYKFK